MTEKTQIALFVIFFMGGRTIFAKVGTDEKQEL